MARQPYFRTFARKLAEEGSSAASALRAWRAAGGRVRTQDWYRVWGELRSQLALSPHEQGRSLLAVPTEGEIVTGTFQRAHGIAHEVLIIGRTRAGEIVTKRVEVPTGQSPIRRLDAIQRAEDWARGFFTREGAKRTDLVTVYGGVHVGTIRRERER